MIAFFRLIWMYRNAVMIGSVILGLLGMSGYFYLKGRTDCKRAEQVKTLTETVKATQEINTDKERIANEVQNMDETALDGELHSLGILRDTSNR